MDLDKTLSRLALVIPVGHIITCTLFLFGYSSGFGSGIGSLFEVGDFFTVSLERLVSMYVLGLGAPLLFVVFRHRKGVAYAADAIAAETDEVKRARLVRSNKRMKSLLAWGAAIIFLQAVALLALASYFDLFRSYYICISLMWVALSIPYWHINNRINFGGVAADLTWVLSTFAVGVVAVGIDAGFRDRRLSPALASSDRYLCERQAILTSLGDRFLTVTQDGVRHVVDEECKVIFDFPRTPALRPISIADAVSEELAKRWP